MCANDFVKRIFIASLFVFVCHQPTSAQIGLPVPIEAAQLEVTANQTSTLVFPVPIKSVDRGSGALICKTIKGIDNVLKVKAADSTMAPTNLTVYTADGQIYPFSVTYNAHPLQLVQEFYSVKGRTALQFSGAEHTDLDVRQIADSLTKTIGIRHRPRAKGNNGMHMVMSGAYLSKDLLFLQFKVSNFRRVRYDVDFVRYYIRDRHQQKRTIRMEKEVKPLFVAYSQSEGIVRHHPLRIVVAFDKFTISDKKQFMAEIYEHNGDRRLVCTIKGRHLLKVTPI